MSALNIDQEVLDAYYSNKNQYIVMKLCRQTFQTIYLTGKKETIFSAEIAKQENLSSEERQQKIAECFMSMTEECLIKETDPRYVISRFIKHDKELVDVGGFFLWCPDGADVKLLEIYMDKKDEVSGFFRKVAKLPDYTTADTKDSNRYIASLNI